MKKLFSSILLMCIVIIGFLLNSMMTFAMHENMKGMQMNMLGNCCEMGEVSCILSCCIQQESQTQISNINHNIIKQKAIYYQNIMFNDFLCLNFKK